MTIIFPGNIVPIEASEKVKVGPGIHIVNQQAIAYLAGALNIKDSKYFMMPRGKRYIPITNDVVIGIITHKNPEQYRVDIGGPHPAVLSALAFEGATRRNRPQLEIGNLVYSRITIAHKDMDPELECITKNGNSDIFGELQNGYMFKCSLSLAHTLLDPQNKLVTMLGEKFPFELAVGMNGRVWIKSDSPRRTILIVNTIKNSEHISTSKEQKSMMKALVRTLGQEES